MGWVGRLLLVAVAVVLTFLAASASAAADGSDAVSLADAKFVNGSIYVAVEVWGDGLARVRVACLSAEGAVEVVSFNVSAGGVEGARQVAGDQLPDGGSLVVASAPARCGSGLLLVELAPVRGDCVGACVKLVSGDCMSAVESLSRRVDVLAESLRRGLASLNESVAGSLSGIAEARRSLEDALGEVRRGVASNRLLAATAVGLAALNLVLVAVVLRRLGGSVEEVEG